MNSKVYTIFTKKEPENLFQEVSVEDNFSNVPYLVYYNFWDNIAIMEYDFIQNTNVLYFYNREGEVQFKVYRNSYSECIVILSNMGYSLFPERHELSQDFHSYPAAILHLVEWAADLAYTKRHIRELLVS